VILLLEHRLIEIIRKHNWNEDIAKDDFYLYLNNYDFKDEKNDVEILVEWYKEIFHQGIEGDYKK
jgi:hypothetical protein